MLFSVAVGISGVSSSSVPPYICGGSYLSVGRGMRAMGGAVKPPARCCSKSHRICQIRPSMKPIAIAIEISKAISSTKVIDMFLSGQCARLRDQTLPGRFYAATSVKRVGAEVIGTMMLGAVILYAVTEWLWRVVHQGLR